MTIKFGKLYIAKMYANKEHSGIFFVYKLLAGRTDLYQCLNVKTLQTKLFYDIELYELELEIKDNT